MSGRPRYDEAIPYGRKEPKLDGFLPFLSLSKRSESLVSF